MEVNLMRSAVAIEMTKRIQKNSESLLPLETKIPAKNIYLQNCPVCGRPLEIPAEYRGRELNCRHCGGQFTAIDPSSPFFAAQNSTSALLRRADRLLEICSRKLRFRAVG
jgi:rRNA maturation protein Nop10